MEKGQNNPTSGMASRRGYWHGRLLSKLFPFLAWFQDYRWATFLLGLFRLGMTVNFLPHPVMSVLNCVNPYEIIWEEHLVRNAAMAVEGIHKNAHKGTLEGQYPLLRMKFLESRSSECVGRLPSLGNHTTTWEPNHVYCHAV